MALQEITFWLKALLLTALFSRSFISTHAKINVHELRCEVCQRTVEEMVKDVEAVDPDKRINIGEFMLDYKGDVPQKTVELRRSEVYLTELMERVCKKMDDYVRAIMTDTGKLVVIPLIVDGMMNSIIGDAQIIQDGDLNRSLKFYCENIVEEFDEGFVKHFGEMDPDMSDKVCWEYSKLCRDSYPVEYEEDVVAAERKMARDKKKPTSKGKKIRQPRKPRSEMTPEEIAYDDLSHLPITGPGLPPKDDHEYEDEESMEQPEQASPAEDSSTTKDEL